MCKAIDPLLADELQNLPVVPSNNPLDRALAFRNLLRGSALGLPSGQDATDALIAAGYPITPADLALRASPAWWRVEQADRASALTAQAPLFFYLLRESEVVHHGRRFGPTGSAILMEVFGGMLALGLIIVFRSKRGDRVKVLVWDGSGLVLTYKRLEDGKFAWPAVRDGVMRLSRAQFEALFDGLDWRRVHGPRRVRPPAATE